jgi:hypothetical protein
MWRFYPDGPFILVPSSKKPEKTPESVLLKSAPDEIKHSRNISFAVSDHWNIQNKNIGSSFFRYSYPHDILMVIHAE